MGVEELWSGWLSPAWVLRLRAQYMGQKRAWEWSERGVDWTARLVSSAKTTARAPDGAAGLTPTWVEVNAQRRLGRRPTAGKRSTERSAGGLARLGFLTRRKMASWASDSSGLGSSQRTRTQLGHFLYSVSAIGRTRPSVTWARPISFAREHFSSSPSSSPLRQFFFSPSSPSFSRFEPYSKGEGVDRSGPVSF